MSLAVLSCDHGRRDPGIVGQFGKADAFTTRKAVRHRQYD
jgi:hypothetical protein